MLPDLLHIVVPLQELAVFARARSVQPAHLVSDRLALSTGGTSLAIWLLSLML
jgi:hypothetical protein